MKMLFKENDVVRCLETVTADVPVEHRCIEIKAGSTGTVVMVYETGKGIEAYEVEFFVSDQDKYAIATIPSDKVRSAT
jgi:Domain of unknown function (DUF4926)